VKYLNLFKDRQ